MSIKDVMNTNSITCTEDISLAKVYQLMQENECNYVVVIESNAHRKPLGIITEHEMCLEVIGKGRQPRMLTASSVMNTDVLKMPHTMSVTDCADSIKARNAKWALVVDEDGMFCGTVRNSDVKKNKRQSSGYIAPEFFGEQNYYKLNRIY
jgi:signal-transduction protein with cAMP-binding, CBS, and nucleotidyltransferase domain